MSKILVSFLLITSLTSTLIWAAEPTVSTAPTSQTQPATTLRYHFTPGQEIVFAGNTKTTKADTPTRGMQANWEWTFWITNQLTPDSYSALLLTKSWSSALGKPAPTEDPDVNAFPITLYSDGRITSDASILVMLLRNSPFPLLPSTSAQLTQGYSGTVSQQRTETHLAPKLQGANWLLNYRPEGFETLMLGYQPQASATFDPQQGLITHLEKTYSYTTSFAINGHTTIDLKSSTIKDAAWLKQLQHDAPLFITATNKFQTSIDEILESDPAQITPLTTAVMNSLKETLTQISTPELKAILEQSVGPTDMVVAQLKKIQQEQVQTSADLLNKPAPDWTLPLVGSNKSVSLKDLRGKVVILDFWSRTCGWCLLSIPQLNQISDYYKNQPVLLYGVSNDTDPKDAQFIIDKFKPAYPSLSAPAEAPPAPGAKTNICLQYHGDSTPQTIIIDPQGIVRMVHPGYSATLFQKVTKKVDQLLKEQPPTK